jgi:hypothetical protein
VARPVKSAGGIGVSFKPSGEGVREGQEKEGVHIWAEAQLFIKTLRRRGWTLYDINDKRSIVDEFAMKINNGEWRFYDVAADEAKVWITAYFREVRRNLGRETLLTFRSILIGRIAKAAFREAALACEEAEIPS